MGPAPIGGIYHKPRKEEFTEYLRHQFQTSKAICRTSRLILREPEGGVEWGGVWVKRKFGTFSGKKRSRKIGSFTGKLERSRRFQVGF